MSSFERLAVLVDGEFLRKTLRWRLRRPAASSEVMAVVRSVIGQPDLVSYRLYRIFYYTADPLGGVLRHPVDRSTIDLGRTAAHVAGKRLIDEIEKQPDVAVRRGILVHHGWEIGASAVRHLVSGKKSVVEARDVAPKIQQKGVDMRIGLDIASLGFKRTVGAILLITADSDLVPAMKLARREGLRVYLHTAGARGVRPELAHHADRIV